MGRRVAICIKNFPGTTNIEEINLICQRFGNIYEVAKNPKGLPYTFINYYSLDDPYSIQSVIEELSRLNIEANGDYNDKPASQNASATTGANSRVQKTIQQKPRGACVVCKTDCSLSCQRCGDFYCSGECQKSDWPKHRYICFAMPDLVEVVSRNDMEPTVDLNNGASRTATRESSSSPSSPFKQVECPQNNNNPFTHKSNKKKRNISVVESVDYPPSGTSVVITGVSKTNCIYVRSLDPTSDREYKNIVKQVNELAADGPPLSEVPYRGSFAATKFQDDGINYRVLVLTVREDNKVKVAFIDFGNVEYKNMSDLRELPEECIKFKRHTLPVVLKNVGFYENEENILQYIKQFESNDDETFSLVYQKDPSVTQTNYELINTKTGENLNKKIKEMAQAKFSQPLSGANLLSDDDNEPVLVAPFMSEYLPPGKNVPIVVLDNSLIEFGQFTATLDTNIAKLDKLVKRLQVYGESDKKPYTPRMKEYILAKFDEDNLWYRAQVIEIMSENRYLVSFIDYGNEVIRSMQKIRRYPLEIIEPCRTSMCYIDDLPEDISPELANRLKELFPFGGTLNLSHVKGVQEGLVVIEQPEMIELLTKEKFF